MKLPKVKKKHVAARLKALLQDVAECIYVCDKCREAIYQVRTAKGDLRELMAEGEEHPCLHEAMNQELKALEEDLKS